MKRCHGRRLIFSTAALGLAVGMVGCAAWNGGNESIIRVEASQNPAKAKRLTLVGVKALECSDIDTATEKFLAAIAADESYGPAHNNLGLLHFEQGNLYQAVLAFEQAMEFMPSDPTVYYNLALTLESAGKVHDAMELYHQAVAMAPANPVFLGNLVRLRIRMGEEGPDLVTQLQDLVLIETRKDWRQWADRQLSWFHNPALDRGPETPEFETGKGPKESDVDAEARLQDQIIDLTPEDSGQQDDSVLDSMRRSEGRSKSRMSSPEIVPSRPQLDSPKVNSKPIPIRDSGPIQELPPSIDQVPRSQVPRSQVPRSQVTEPGPMDDFFG